MDELILMCCCCRNVCCDYYTLIKGYLFCGYCFEDYMKENLGGKEFIENWMQKHYEMLEAERSEKEEKGA